MLREGTEQLLRLHGLEPNPSQDEQQLIDPEVIEALLDAAEVQGDCTVLEVGPGAGNISTQILARGAVLYAVEKNPKWNPVLTSLFQGNPRFHMVSGDALSILLPPAECVVSNLPYSIAEAFIQRLTRLKFKKAAFLVPRGFAKILTATGGESYTKLSFVSSLFFEVMITRDVPAASYYPEPNVATCLIAVNPRSSLRSELILREALRQHDKKTWNSLREAVIRVSSREEQTSTKRGAEQALTKAGVLKDEGHVARLSLADLHRLHKALRFFDSDE